MQEKISVLPLIAILALALIISFGGCAQKNQQAQQQQGNPQATVPVGQTPVASPSDLAAAGVPAQQQQGDTNTQQAQAPASGSQSPTGTGQNYNVQYTGSGFIPATITIKKGDIVTWTNGTPSPVWPASARHPTHTDYPGGHYDEPGSYQGSLACKDLGQPKTGAFDSCKGLAQGESWTFEFDYAGTWVYHNHLNPSKFGQVIVQ